MFILTSKANEFAAINWVKNLFLDTVRLINKLIFESYYIPNGGFPNQISDLFKTLTNRQKTLSLLLLPLFDFEGNLYAFQTQLKEL